jgi:hypothetical protein
LRSAVTVIIKPIFDLIAEFFGLSPPNFDSVLQVLGYSPAQLEDTVASDIHLDNLFERVMREVFAYLALIAAQLYHAPSASFEQLCMPQITLGLLVIQIDAASLEGENLLASSAPTSAFLCLDTCKASIRQWTVSGETVKAEIVTIEHMATANLNIEEHWEGSEERGVIRGALPFGPRGVFKTPRCLDSTLGKSHSRQRLELLVRAIRAFSEGALIQDPRGLAF